MNSFISRDISLDNISSKDFNKSVLVFHDLEYLKEKMSELYFEIGSAFIVSLEDSASLNEFMSNDRLFSLLFHKHYFLLNNLPVFKISPSISSQHVREFFNYLNNQGYNNFYCWKGDIIKSLEGSNLSIYNVLCSENVIELPTLALLPTNFIHYTNLKDYKTTTDIIKDFISTNNDIKLLHSELWSLWNKNYESEVRLSWANNTIQNYKSYNEVLKKQLRDKRIINYGGKIANQIRRISFLRKILRTLLN